MIPEVPCRATPAPSPLALALVLALAHASGAAAQSASEASESAVEGEREKVACEFEDMTRLISLRVDPEAGYVCDVLYEKPDEGGAREVLWSAKNDAQYCRPRYEDLVQGLADRGWTCDYAEDSPDGEEPAVAAATEARRDDDESTSRGPRGKFRDWCVTDAVNAQEFEVEGPIRDYCDCVARGMDSRGLSEEDVRLIFDGLSSVSAGQDDGAEITDKRLNTLTTSYRDVVEFCG